MAASASYLYKCQPNAVQRIYCFPHAGGWSQPYLQWQDSLAPSIEVCTMQLPGRGERYGEKMDASISELVDHFSRVIANSSGISYSLFGHSFGALLSYEVARKLCSGSIESPERLIVSGCEAAHVMENERNRATRSDAEIIESLKNLGGSPSEVLSSPELIELMLPVIRYDYSLLDQYLHKEGALIDVPLTVLHGLDDRQVTEENIARWNELTSSNCTIHRFQGGHFYFEENKEEVMKVLNFES